MQTDARTFNLTSVTAPTEIINTGDAITVQASGTFVATVEVQASNDKTTWYPIALTPAAGGAAVTSFAAVGLWTVPNCHYLYLRPKASAYTSGTATVIIGISNTGA